MSSKKKEGKPKAAKRPKTKVIDIDLANRDNIVASLKQNTKIPGGDNEVMLLATVLIEAKQMLVKNWREIRNIRDEHFEGKIKFNIPVVVDCTATPSSVKVKLSVPRPAHKDAAEMTTEDPEQLKLDTVSDTIPVRSSNGVVLTPGDQPTA
jgi:hypothetical protein